MKNTDTMNIVLIQHELLLAIGKTLDIKVMLDTFSNVAIKALSAPSIHIILKQNTKYNCGNKVFSYPNITDSGYDVFDSSFMKKPDNTEFLRCVSSGDMHSYIYSIKNIGYIIFERYQKEFHENLVQALTPIIERLGFACFSCYQHRQMKNNSQKTEISEIKLRLEKAKLQTTLGAISNGVITLNRELEILYMNPKAESLLKLSNVDYKDQSIIQFFTLFDNDDNKNITDIFFDYLKIKGGWKNVMPLT